MARIDFYQNGQLFLKLHMDNRQISLGRSNECDIILPHPKVSRHHARLEPENGGWVLRNQGMNGTRVNAMLVTEAPQTLEYGDRIYIESYTLVLSEDDADDNMLLEMTSTTYRAPTKKVGLS